MHHTSTFPNSSADARNRPSGEKATDRTQFECPGSLRGFVSAPSTCRSQTNRSGSEQSLHRNATNWRPNPKKRQVNEPGDPPTRCPCLNSPMPIQWKANIEKSTASECDDWLLSIHRPNLPNAKEEKCCSVTLTDPSHEQLTSRPSSAFHRRDQTLSYLMRLRRGFCRLIHPFLFLQIFANEFRVKMAGPFTIRNDWRWCVPYSATWNVPRLGSGYQENSNRPPWCEQRGEVKSVTLALLLPTS